MWFALAAIGFVIILGAWSHSQANSQKNRARRWRRRIDQGALHGR